MSSGIIYDRSWQKMTGMVFPGTGTSKGKLKLIFQPCNKTRFRDFLVSTFKMTSEHAHHYYTPTFPQVLVTSRHQFSLYQWKLSWTLPSVHWVFLVQRIFYRHSNGILKAEEVISVRSLCKHLYISTYLYNITPIFRWCCILRCGAGRGVALERRE